MGVCVCGEGVPTLFSLKLDQPAQEKEEDAALASPVLLAAQSVALSLMHGFTLPVSRHMVLTLLSDGRGSVSTPSSSHPLCLCSFCSLCC